MAYNFPNSPAVNDIFLDYKWDGEKWILQYGGVAAPEYAIVYATLDGTPSNATLSNGNLTVTHSNTSTGGGKSLTSKSAGKYYFEFTVGARHGQLDAFSLMPVANSYGQAYMAGTSLYLDTTFFSSGNVSIAGSGGGRWIGPIGLGDNIGVAVDMGNMRCWFRRNGGLWNGYTDDPSVPSSGNFISGTAPHIPMLSFDGSNSVASDTFTFNFGKTVFVYAVPSGFTSGWPV